MWRTWLVRPDRDGAPILTGIFGYPWPAATLDARCLHTERTSPLPFTTATTGRYHRVVPDPACTCGVYAVRDPIQGAPRFVRVRSEPVVTGLVRLSGRVLAEPDRFRAQRATIVGPVALALPPPPLPVRLVAPAARPRRVFPDAARYRVSWAGGSRGEPVARWRERTTAALMERYGVPVVSVVE